MYNSDDAGDIVMIKLKVDKRDKDSYDNGMMLTMMIIEILVVAMKIVTIMIVMISYNKIKMISYVPQEEIW